jgi:molybdopterin-containing oxidoreductase family membrane subunit
MNDAVPWGLYTGTFSFMVGLSSAALVLIVMGFVTGQNAVRGHVLLGQVLAIATLVTGMLFVMVDLGRPERFWHMLPVVGMLNWPTSLLAWDFVVLAAYLTLNVVVVGWSLVARFMGRPLTGRVREVVMGVAAAVAVSVHLVAACLYTSQGARAHWHAAILLPRFLVGAVASGSALLIVTFLALRKLMDYRVKDSLLARLRMVVAGALLLDLFFFLAEAFTELYPNTAEAASLRYTLFGLEGHHALVPYTWLGLALEAYAVVALLVPRLHARPGRLVAACGAAIGAMWIEKVAGVVLPGFVPSTMGELHEYSPSQVELFITAGVLGLGGLMATVMFKVGLPIHVGAVSMAHPVRRPVRERVPRPVGGGVVVPQPGLFGLPAEQAASSTERG